MASSSNINNDVILTKDKTQWTEFKRDDQYLYPDDKETEYNPGRLGYTQAIHWGQRKLALTLIQFLNLYMDRTENNQYTVVYAGAATGTNIGFVARMYPSVEWHLYDPLRFSIKEASNIKIYTGNGGWFDDNVAKEWGKASEKGLKILFVSDIRSIDTQNADKKGYTVENVERGVWKDMQNQEKWVRLIKPVAAHLKFRLPYPGNKFDDDIDHTKNMAPYMAGIVYLQSRIGVKSAESRLVVTPQNPNDPPNEWKYPSMQWDFKKYEQQMYHHNTSRRAYINYYNPIGIALNDDDIKKDNLDNPELLNSWDDMMEYMILNDYLVIHNVKDIHEKIKALSTLLTKWLDISKYSSKYKSASLSVIRANPDFIRSNKTFHRNP